MKNRMFTQKRSEKYTDSRRQDMLHLVPTPIGNLEDMTYRAVRILQEADLIAAEDTRTSKKLLDHYDVKTPLTSYHEHNKIEKAQSLLEKLREGARVALITDAGHELKTPLAVINADCDVLEMESEDSANEWLEDIRKQTERLSELTNSLIYLAKTEEGSKNALVKIEFPLSDIVSEETESFRGLAKSSGKSIETSITPDITYNGDQKAIRRLISILMDNAIKYSPDGSVIRASLARNGSKTVFAVTNKTSSPVSKDDMKHMFDRFYRTDESRNSETGGYGIGLSVAKSITEAHGGKIYASGTGDEITVTSEI